MSTTYRNHTPFGLGANIYNALAPESRGEVIGISYTDCEGLSSPHVPLYKVRNVRGEAYIPFGYAAAEGAEGSQPAPEVDGRERIRFETHSGGEDGVSLAYCRADGECWTELLGRDGLWRRLSVETYEGDILWNAAIALGAPSAKQSAEQS